MPASPNQPIMMMPATSSTLRMTIDSRRWKTSGSSSQS